MKLMRIIIILFVLLPPSYRLAVYAQESVYPRITYPLFFDPEIPSDIREINEALNRITRSRIGTEIEIIPLLAINSDKRRLLEFEMMEKEGIQFDILVSMIPDADWRPLDTLLDTYGEGIIPLIEKYRLDSLRREGALYSLPICNDYVNASGIAMRTDLIEKYHLDVSPMDSLDKLTPLFETIKRNEPGMKLVSSYRTNAGFLYRHKSRKITDTLFIQSPDDPGYLVNYYETKEYSRHIRIFREWFQKDYVPDNLLFLHSNASQLVHSGELFSYFCAYKPGIGEEETRNSGRKMTVIPLFEPLVTHKSVSRTQYGISADCEYPEKAMQFLNLLYTDPELVNLLIYGLEGVHYAQGEEGTIELAINTGDYGNTLPWLFPNELISHIRSGSDPGLWEETEKFNRTAEISGSVGFVFDDSAVAEQNRALLEIEEKYAYGLETGQLDPGKYLPMMIEEMEQAGLETVREEIQAQFDAWRGR